MSSYISFNCNSLLRKVGAVIKRKIPETFSTVEKVQTDLGEFPVSGKKGEGGANPLFTRIADNFYNRFLR